MAEQFLVTTGTVALTAATANIPIEIAPASTLDAVLVSLDVTFDAPGATAPKIELCTYGTVGSGGSTPTPTKYGQNQNRAASTVVRIADSTPPTTITALWTWYSTGLFYQWPLGREFELLQSGKYCIRVTAPATCNCCINLVFEE